MFVILSKEITGNDERTKNDARNDIETTANSVNFPIISKIKVLILNVQSMKFHHHETPKKSDSNYLENE